MGAKQRLHEMKKNIMKMKVLKTLNYVLGVCHSGEKGESSDVDQTNKKETHILNEEEITGGRAEKKMNEFASTKRKTNERTRNIKNS